MRARAVAAWILCSVLAGIVVATAALPGSLLAGLAAKSASDTFEALPADLQTPTPAQTTYIYANDGKTLITAFYDTNRRDVKLAQVSKVMQQAMVAAEDTRYFQHGGVDLKAVLRALVSNSGGSNNEQGASTLTMQYVRNVLKTDPNLTPQERIDATQDTAGRKVQEMRYAIALEQKLSKNDILERYMNIAYFGDGAYGIDAAAETYFGVGAGQLNLQQSALIAGLVQSPDTYNPVGAGKTAALGRRTYVLGAMVKMGAVTQAQADAADKTDIGLNPRKAPNDCAAVSNAHNDWGFFCDYFRQWWDQQIQFGATVEDREQALLEGGYTIVTTLDPKIQASALTNSLKVYGYGKAKAAPIAVISPGTGKVLALAVNRHYSLTPNPGGAKYPNTVNQLIAGGGSVNGYQAGSTFKMFTMLAALEAGKPLSTSFNAPAKLETQYSGGEAGDCNGHWCPGNDNPSWMDGDRTMWNGFGRSVNTYFVWLEEQIGSAKVVEMAQRLGIKLRAASDQNEAKNSADSWGAFTLGVADTTPLDLANAYATLGAGGLYCSPLPVNSITDSNGKAITVSPACKQVITPDIAAAATDAARCPVGDQSAYGKCDGGTATMVGSIMGNRPVAGKTGSSEENSTETQVAFTPQLAAAGTAVDPDDPKDHVGTSIEGVVSTAIAHVLAAASVGLPVRQFVTPSSSIANG